MGSRRLTVTRRGTCKNTADVSLQFVLVYLLPGGLSDRFPAAAGLPGSPTFPVTIRSSTATDLFDVFAFGT